MQHNNILDDHRIGRLLFRLSLPAFVGMFVMTLYNVVDTIFIGHYVGPIGIAALSIVFPVQMIAMGIGQMTGIGGASLISRLIGGKNKRGAEQALGNALTSTFVLSGIVMIVGLIWLDGILARLGASETILPHARVYMKIILIGLFFRSFAMLMSTLIRAEGNSRIPMAGMILGATLNTLLDAVLIVFFSMGIEGAAWATVIAEMASVAYLAVYYASGKNYLKITITSLAVEWPALRAIFSIGIAAFAMGIASSLSAVFVNRLCVAYGGDMAVSAFGIFQRIIMFALMPALVVGQGLQPIVGFNYGAKQYARVLKAITIAMTAATVCCTLAYVVLHFYPGPLISVFTADSTLLSLSEHGIRRMCGGVFLIGVIVTGATIFQALGKAVPSFVTSTARTVLFLIPLVYTLPNYMGIDGIWWAFPIADGLTFALTLTLILPQLKRISKEQKFLQQRSGR